MKHIDKFTHQLGKIPIHQTFYSTPPRATLHDHINTDDFKEDREKEGDRKKEGEVRGNGGQRKGIRKGSKGNREEKDKTVTNGQS